MTDLERYVVDLAGRLLDDFVSVSSRFETPRPHAVDIAAHQFVWAHHIATGAPRFGDAVLQALCAISRSTLVDHVDGGLYSARTDDERRGPQLRKTLSDHALFLELLTWVWRVARCPELRRCAEGIAGWAVAQMRVPGFGFAASTGADGRDDTVAAGWNGLMLVALVEAGSVFERRDWLALTRDVFDELVCLLTDGARLRHGVTGERRGPLGFLDDYAMMSRAAIRLFEAFGKPRYLELAETWVATLDDAFRGAAHDGYGEDAADLRCPRPCPSSATDITLPSGNAPLIGVLARLHALTGTPSYAERAGQLAVAVHRAMTAGSGFADATAIANVQTLACLVTIKVSGDPRLPETRELMRIALDCGLPDRLVLGPGAGHPADASPKAQVCLGSRRLAPIADAARLRAVTAPGGLANAA